ncbi:TonB-dependent receptor [Sphingomonas lenta]|uniref:TonB-dependent receptor n=1 Tax=Sphingomonas lenta TaxID=1141887 RepID=UPI001FE4F2C5|nr:TonB-dependent receptor [Sphingomonas lenta]
MIKTSHLLAASVFALAVATPAHAQDTAGSPGTTTPGQPPADAAQTPPTQSPATAAQVAPDPADATLAATGNDIVVTATRRNETVQNVPIAITAVPAELLRDAAVQDVRDLEQLAPSLQTTTGQSQATGSSFAIRGIGTAGDNPGFEPAVGVFIDGVFRSRAGVALSELPELERVEVLRGPQGTLFGRNTSAGALSIFTAKPQFELGGYVEGAYGNLDAYELRGAITGPVTDQIALRFDGAYRKRDGFIRDANSDRRINNIDRYLVRGQALFDNGDVTFRLIGDYTETDENCCGAVSVVRGPLAPVIQGIAAAQGLVGLYTGSPSDRIQAISPNRSYAERVKDWGVSGELNFSLGAVNVTSITAYRDFRVLRDQDIDFSGIDRAYRDEYRSDLTDFTQEIRFQGTAFGDFLDFLVGGFYLDETLTLRDTVRFGRDANRYVDTVFAGLARSQFFGSFNVPTLPQLGASLVGGPALPANTVPLLGQLIYLQNPQVAPNVRLQQIAPPGSPLFALLNSPLPGAQPGQGNNNDNFRVKTTALAAFTHNILNLTDQLKLTLGLRYNYEKKELDADIRNNSGSCAFFDQLRAGNQAAATYAALIRGASPTLFNNLFLLGCNPAVNTEFNGAYQDDREENVITGTAKLSYAFSPRYLVYGSYDRGYKSGGYNLDQATFDSVLLGGNGPQGSDLEFGRETVDSFEVGVKTSPSPQFTFNLAGFYAKYKGLQNLVFAGNNFVVQNISDSTSKGIEAESIFRPSTDLTVRLGYTFNDVQVDEDVTFPANSPLQGSQGQQFANIPRHAVTFSTTWNPQLTAGLRGIVHVDGRFNSEVEISQRGSGTAIAGRAAIRNEAYALVNALAGVQTDDGRLRGEVFVENLTDKFFFITGFPVPEQTGNFAGYPGQPRTYGVRVRVGF